jgi:hypothetical protein
MDNEAVEQIRLALQGGIPEQLIIETMVGEGADPIVVRRVIDQAKSPPRAPSERRQSPRPTQGYRPIDGQPNASQHVQQSKPDPVIQKVHTEATIEMNKIATSHHNTEQTISELQAFMFLAKYLGWSLMVGDGIFSYWALKVSLNNQWIALYLAVGICAAIFIMGVAITIKSVDEIFVLDKNEDGQVTLGEKGWFVIRAFIAIVCVGTDVLSNYMGMDALLAKSLSPTSLIPGWSIALFLAIAIMLLPQVIVSWGDVNMRTLAKLKPMARVEAANIQGDTNWATGYQKEVATRTASVGQAEGSNRVKNWKIRL